MRVLLFCIALVLAGVLPSWGSEVLVLQSSRSRTYDEALRGFRAVITDSCETVVLSDYAEVNVERLVREERPRVVLAVGDAALAAVRKVREVPVVALLSLSLNLRKDPPEHIGGVSMVAAPEQYLRLLCSWGMKKIGVLYDPARSGRYLKRLTHDAKQMGVTVVAEPVGNAREVQGRLEKMKGSVDALWMLPDSTVVTTVNLEAFMLFAANRNVPVVTFSGNYLKYGAAAALEVDYFDMGVQAGELARTVKDEGVDGRRIPILDPRKTPLRTNESVMRKISRRGGQ